MSNEANEDTESGSEATAGHVWQQLFEEAKRLELSHPERVEEFKLKWSHAFYEESRHAGLCHLAGSDPSEWRHDQIKFLVEQLLEAQPDQPGWWDEDEPDAPLRIALEKEHHSFIQVFLDGCGPDTLYAILSEKTRHHPQETILHLAISLRSPFTERIMRTCSAEDPIFSAQDRMGWTPLHLAVTAEDAAFAAWELGSDSRLPWRLPAFSSYDTVRQLIARHTRALFLEDSDWHTPYRRRLVWLLRRERMPDGSSTQPNTSDKAADRGLSDALTNDPVLSYIRTYVIRRFPPAKASQALYPAGQERQVEFAMEMPMASSQNLLEWMERHLVFESVLKRVTLSKRKVEVASQVRRTAESQGERLDYNARDAFRTFEWLRQRGVRKIIDVVVVDSENPCHSNETIQDALEGFEVETWDWQRNDIPSSVIASSSSVVNQLTLYFSGSEATMKDWCGSEGFPNETLFPEALAPAYTPSLRSGESTQWQVAYRGPTLTICEEIDAAAVGRNDTSALSDAFKQADREVSVVLDSDIQRLKQPGQNKAATHSEEGWPSMASAFWQRTRSKFALERIPRVKIALVCDGVDVAIPELQDMVVSGITLGEDPWYISTRGHGTAQARVICKLCPHIQLHVAKLAISAEGTLFREDCLIDAVKWAMQRKVDIICLGPEILGLNVTMGPELLQSLDWAKANGIAILCAGFDGPEASHTYRLIRRHCILIGWLETSPKWEHLQGSETVDFLFDIAGVPASFWNNGNRTPSHSTIATSMACGFGALLVCVRRFQDSNEEDKRALPLREFLLYAIRNCIEDGKSVVVMEHALEAAGKVDFRAYMRWLTQALYL
ncbi:hypothetical protein BDW68DRAFT_182999 [Aspergillus falconensis]